MGQEESRPVGDTDKVPAEKIPKQTKQTVQPKQIPAKKKVVAPKQKQTAESPSQSRTKSKSKPKSKSKEKAKPSEPVKQSQETEQSQRKEPTSQSSRSRKATTKSQPKVEIQEESPHVQQTTQVETIKVQRAEEQPSKQLRTVKEYKEWADRTAFSFPPKRASQATVEEEGPHVQQTTQVETIKVQRAEEQPSKQLRTAREYKEWADRTAFSFPPKQVKEDDSTVEPNYQSESVKGRQSERASQESKEASDNTAVSVSGSQGVQVQDESPHVQQTTQVETIKVERAEEQPSKQLRTAKEYKEWADRTAFSFPPKQRQEVKENAEESPHVQQTTQVETIKVQRAEEQPSKQLRTAKEYKEWADRTAFSVAPKRRQDDKDDSVTVEPDRVIQENRETSDNTAVSASASQGVHSQEESPHVQQTTQVKTIQVQCAEEQPSTNLRTAKEYKEWADRTAFAMPKK